MQKDKSTLFFLSYAIAVFLFSLLELFTIVLYATFINHSTFTNDITFMCMCDTFFITLTTVLSIFRNFLQLFSAEENSVFRTLE